MLFETHPSTGRIIWIAIGYHQQYLPSYIARYIMHFSPSGEVAKFSPSVWQLLQLNSPDSHLPYNLLITYIPFWFDWCGVVIEHAYQCSKAKVPLKCRRGDRLLRNCRFWAHHVAMVQQWLDAFLISSWCGDFLINVCVCEYCNCCVVLRCQVLLQ